MKQSLLAKTVVFGVQTDNISQSAEKQEMIEREVALQFGFPMKGFSQKAFDKDSLCATNGTSVYNSFLREGKALHEWRRWGVINWSVRQRCGNDYTKSSYAVTLTIFKDEKQ